MQNVIFDLQRCSLLDGPGIRTTVFLKGCPLRCLWCHNPESQACQPELSYDADRCTRCRACEDVCEAKVHQFARDGLHLADFKSCVTQGACLKVCPTGALRHYGYEGQVDRIIEEVLRDRAYYEKSGGGFTLSGGEPTLQPEFCLELLREAKSNGIHTCLETCGIAEQGVYERLLPFVDLFLFDYKATDSELHKKLTRVSNERILKNLFWLHSQGARILLRCPLVPGVNDDEAHLSAIRNLRRTLQGIEVELLPFHALGLSKYARTGRPIPELATRTPDAALQSRWHDLVFATV